MKFACPLLKLAVTLNLVGMTVMWSVDAAPVNELLAKRDDPQKPVSCARGALHLPQTVADISRLSSSLTHAVLAVPSECIRLAASVTTTVWMKGLQ